MNEKIEIFALCSEYIINIEEKDNRSIVFQTCRILIFLCRGKGGENKNKTHNRIHSLVFRSFISNCQKLVNINCFVQFCSQVRDKHTFCYLSEKSFVQIHWVIRLIVWGFLLTRNCLRNYRQWLWVESLRNYKFGTIWKKNISSVCRLSFVVCGKRRTEYQQLWRHSSFKNALDARIRGHAKKMTWKFLL